MSCFSVVIESDEIKNMMNEEEEKWAIDAALDIYNNATEAIINPLIKSYNDLWPNGAAFDKDDNILDKCPYIDRYDEWCKHAYDAMSYIYGVNPKTHRILKLDHPFVLIHESGRMKIFGHIENFEM